MENTDSDETKKPAIFETFRRSNQNPIKTNFDGNFGNKFELKGWIRRPSGAISSDDKEHVFCGSDSELLNRHHYGLYFYHRNIKFLLRREKNQFTPIAADDFYPSLWEWSIENIEGDSEWHFYEIKYDYPNAALYIDGIHYEENTTNSDIIDAHELEDVSATGLKVIYIGACYNGRTHGFSSYFSGDIAGLSLHKVQVQDNGSNKIDCQRNCNEYMDLNMIGNENYLSSVEFIQNNLIKIKTQTYTDLLALLKKIHYVNKNVQTLTKAQVGKRYVKLNTEIICYKNPENNTDNRKLSVSAQEFVIDIDVKMPKKELSVEIDGNRQFAVSKNVLINQGISIFKEISILLNEVNSLMPETDSNEINNSDEELDDEKVYLSLCSIKISPANSNEKFMFASYNDDELFGVNDDFKISRVNDVVKVEGLNTIKSYEAYLRNLVFILVENKNTIDSNKLIYLSCMRSEPAIETNSILIQVFFD